MPKNIRPPRIAVFLGAGASKPFGYPLTRDLFPVIRDRLKNGMAFPRRQKRKSGSPKYDARKNANLTMLLRRLLPGFRSAKNLPDITDVLSLIDYSVLVGNAAFPRANAQELMRLRLLMDEAILHALLAPQDKGSGSPRLTRLADWLVQVGKSRPGVGLISTNYDTALDRPLFKAYGLHYSQIGKQFDLGMHWRAPFGTEYGRPSDPEISIYKLHGSLNWLRCDHCEHMYLSVRSPIAHLTFQKRMNDTNTCHCGHGVLRMVLVAPSLVRDIRDVNLLGVWKAALNYLRTADEWIIIGYSLPSEDIAIRSLFLRAYQGRESKTPPTVRVIQLKADAALTSRYRLLFPKCTFKYGGIEAFIDKLPAAPRALPKARRRPKRRRAARLEPRNALRSD